jgi:Tfp pilus assembly protein PilF
MRSFFFTFLLLFTLLESSKAQDALKALKYFDEGDITKGIEKLEKGIEKDTGAPANYFVLAHLYSLPSFYAESVDSAHYYIHELE